jgi:hypothetical protein
MKLYIFRAVPLSIIRNLFTVHSAMVYVIHVCRQLSSRTILVLLESSKDELSETCRVSWQNKSVKLEHLVGFITKNIRLLLYDKNYKMLIKSGSCCLVAVYTIWTIILLLFSYNFNNFRTLTNTVLYLQAHLTNSAEGFHSCYFHASIWR